MATLELFTTKTATAQIEAVRLSNYRAISSEDEVMNGAKNDKYREYEHHGQGLDSLGRGFDLLGMPNERRQAARELVVDVMDVNGAAQLYWYMTSSTNELACYWDDAPVNTLWITPIGIHLHKSTPRPSRTLTYQKSDGDLVGWLLPGAVSGGGGGPERSTSTYVLCPREFVQIPAGSTCHVCDERHD